MTSVTQRKSKLWGWGVIVGCILLGCSTKDRFAGSDAAVAGHAGASLAAGSGGGAAGPAGAAGAGGSNTSLLGAACTKDSDCGKLSCDREIKQLITVNGAPEGQLDVSLFPGGSCTPLPLAAYDASGGKSCDPTMPHGSQGCGPDGDCLSESVQGQALVGCRKSCKPSATESGCERKGYTCDFGAHACIEGCHTDSECRLQLIDSNGDGTPDGSAYDKASTATCDPKTARCTHAGGNQPSGASCKVDEDCGGDGVCISAGTSIAGQRFPDGYCTKVGCDVAGRECAGGAVCEPLRPLLAAVGTNALCLSRCTVGAEPADLQRGLQGHGMGCRAGYRCAYNGGSGAQSGVCVGGEYNAVTTNNIGAGCKVNADCFSPFGAARCLRYGLPDDSSSAGICTLLDCNAPGLPKDLCGAGNECVWSSSDQASCEHNCSTASECPATFACNDDDGDPTTSKVCYPVCDTAADCRPNEHCKLFASFSVGQCVLQ